MRDVYINATEDRTWYRVEHEQRDDLVRVVVHADWREVPSPKLDNLALMGYDLMMMRRTLSAQGFSSSIDLQVRHLPEKPDTQFFYDALIGRLQRQSERLPKLNGNGAKHD